MDELDEYQEWLSMTWGFGSMATIRGGDGVKVDDKYRELTPEEREEEQRKLQAWDERRERGPGYAAPLCGAAAENDAFRV